MGNDYRGDARYQRIMKHQREKLKKLRECRLTARASQLHTVRMINL